ncbi:MAG: malonyl-CoA decarboxylase [Pseudomonadota bacterium]
MTVLADMLSTILDRRPRLRGVAPPADRPMADLATDLLGTSGEVSGMAIARAILDRYAGMDDIARLDFFRMLAWMNLVPDRVRDTLAAYESMPSKATYRAFSAAAEPPRQELIRRLNQVPGATGELVAMRADLLRLGTGEPELEALDLDFRHLFASWFNRGFLLLRPIDWQTPANLLEKIIEYEAVHDISGWGDLRRRLEPPDRRCFAFFHPAMPDEPLIFVEVALTSGVATSIQTLLADGRDPIPAQEADTAVFYSISNCQKGLASISFGSSLIKQVAADLAADLPGLKTFMTLSPIPGLARWAEEAGTAVDPDDAQSIRRLAARYLLEAKTPSGRPRDPVARFHLGNGAVLQAVHAKADMSEKGRRQSGGAMVNYLYDLDRMSQNHERFAATGEIVASADVRALWSRDRSPV